MGKPRGFTLIDVLIGIFIITVALFAIAGLVLSSFKLMEAVSRKVVAANIAIEELEKIRNLEYQDIGTLGASLPFAQGSLNPSDTVERNGISYNIQRIIKYVSDTADGQGSSDDCDLDYKKIDIKVSFSGIVSGEETLSSIASPRDLVDELQSCANQPGGVLSVLVFDAQGIPINSPVITISDPSTGELIDQAVPSSGKYDFLLSPGTYKISTSKQNFSTDRTYGIDEIAQPENPHKPVIDGEVTNASFSIDKVSVFDVSTLYPASISSFSDPFDDFSKSSNYSNVQIVDGELELLNAGSGYESDGFVESQAIQPSTITKWALFSFSDNILSETSIKYRVYYYNGSDWQIIPDSDLPGNSVGFTSSPVDLSGLDVAVYQTIKVRADLHTSNSSKSPKLDLWQVSWQTSNETPAPNIQFLLTGNKIIGLDDDNVPVPKFSQSYSSNSSGLISIGDLEWDNYTFSSLDPDLDLISTDPSPQPIFLAPDSVMGVKLYFQAQNSLFVSVKDADTLMPIQLAQVRLYNSDSYDKTNSTDIKGQTVFIPLDVGSYTLEINISGYPQYSENINISGDVIKDVFLQRLE